MLTENDDRAAVTAGALRQPGMAASARAADEARSRLSRMMRAEWLGQMGACWCWIASVLSYGISSLGDWLQLAAACCWMFANVASIVSVGDD